MPIEAATYINQLDAANPAGADLLADADNHIRLIKAAIKATFPNITGPVTSTQAQLAATVPAGIVALWSGSVGTIPSGWVLCQGQTVPKSDGSGNITAPALLDRFIVGAGSGYAVGATGGATSSLVNSSAAGGNTPTGTISAAGNHNHGAATGGGGAYNTTGPTYSVGTFSTAIPQYSMSVATSGGAENIPNHTHGIINDGNHTHTLTMNAIGDHQHSVTVATLPPYYALCYIMKT